MKQANDDTIVSRSQPAPWVVLRYKGGRHRNWGTERCSSPWAVRQVRQLWRANYPL